MSRFKVPYSAVGWFESVLRQHKCVRSIERSDHHFFRINRKAGDTIGCVLVDIYTIGIADVIKAKEEFPEMTCIVTSGNWNSYTRDAKEYGRSCGLGVFQSSEFSGALWKDDLNSYYQKDKDGKPVYSYGKA
jgi:hypothetical protein